MIILSLSFMLAYITGMVYCYGTPESLSSTWFNIAHKWIFSFIIVVAFGLIMAPMIEMLDNDYKMYGFLTSASGMMIGVAANLSEEISRKVHMTSAVILAICSQVVVGCMYSPLLFFWSICFIPLLLDRGHIKFWVEMIGGALLYVTLIRFA